MTSVAGRTPGPVTATKVLVTGPHDAGKTTFVRTIAGPASVSTERPVSDRPPGEDARTTVAMDYGRVVLGDELALYLFGTPGQERFGFMREILAEGMLGFVLLVDAQREASVEEARAIHRHLTAEASVPSVVAVNKLTDRPTGPALDEIAGRLDLGAHVPVLATDAREHDAVKHALLALLRTVREHTTGGAGRGAAAGVTDHDASGGSA